MTTNMTFAPGIAPAVRRRRHLRRRWSVALTALLALTGVVAAGPAHATFAGGGSGLYVGSIDWFEWGADGDAIPAGGVTKTNTRTVEGKDLVTTCTLSGISGGLSTYRSGDWWGDAFDNMYNVGGADNANTMVAGLANTVSGGTVSFTFACSVTYDGTSLPMAGLVFADAESSTTIGGEYIEATPSPAATWRIIDRTRAAGCATSSIATLTSGTLRLAPDGLECSDSGGYGPAAVAFMQGATSAAVTLKGRGYTAVALGVVLESDFGDAPASYGAAGAFYQSGWTGGTVPVGSTNVFNGFTMATTTAPGTRLGATIDSEPASQFSVGATGDGADEDAISPPGTVSNLFAGAPYTLTGVACTAGVVRGWIDWNHNGAFDSGEASRTATCTGPSVDLLWSSIPSDVVAASTYLRLRIADSSAELASPTGMSLSGEVEDYAITIALHPIPTPLANPDSASGEPEQPVHLTPLTNDVPSTGETWDPSTLCLMAPEGATSEGVTVVAGTTCAKKVAVPDVGAWVVNLDGTATFTSVAGFLGTAEIRYLVTDTSGLSPASTMAVTIVLTLAATGTNAIATGGLAVLALVAGALLVLVGRRLLQKETRRSAGR